MLYFVGVGPGDRELLTLKAVRILRQADAIALPDSGRDSVVWKIAGEWMQNKPVCRLPMPMKGMRTDWEAAHRRAADTLMEWLDRYPLIAYPVLGDPGIYASSAYLMRCIAPRHPCRVIPGVPAMCAAAAQLGLPLCRQGEMLTVTDHLDGESLPQGNVVIMKGAGKLHQIRAAARGRRAYALCNLGMQDMWCGPLEDTKDMPETYFTTVLVQGEPGA